MYPDEIELSPFETRHIGEHGAFIHRTNAELVKQACRRIAERRLVEVSFAVTRDSDRSPKGGDKGTLGSVHESAGPQDIARITPHKPKLRAVS